MSCSAEGSAAAAPSFQRVNRLVGARLTEDLLAAAALPGCDCEGGVCGDLCPCARLNGRHAHGGEERRKGKRRKRNDPEEEADEEDAEAEAEAASTRFFASYECHARCACACNVAAVPVARRACPHRASERSGLVEWGGAAGVAHTTRQQREQMRSGDHRVRGGGGGVAQEGRELLARRLVVVQRDRRKGWGLEVWSDSPSSSCSSSASSSASASVSVSASPPAVVVRAGEAVAAYFGEAISSAEARRRHAAAPAANYILTVEEVFGGRSEGHDEGARKTADVEGGEEKERREEEEEEEEGGGLRGEGKMRPSPASASETTASETTSTIVRTSVDARHWGASARFVNHRCSGANRMVAGCPLDRPEGTSATVDAELRSAGGREGGFDLNCCGGPNLVMRPVRKGSRLPVPVFWAARDIFDGEELTIDYAGTGSVGTAAGESQGGGNGGGAAAADTAADATGRVPCLCGAKYCRGFLPFDPI